MDMKTNQYHVKALYDNKVLEVREIWADSPSAAMIKAHSLAESKLETQIETPVETMQRTGVIRVADCVYMIAALRAMNDPRVEEFEAKLEELREKERMIQIDNPYYNLP